MSIYVVSTYPTNDLEQVIAKLTEKTKLRVLLDGNFDGTITPLLHSPTNHEFAVLSRGEDGILNSDDDLYSWK